MEVYLCMTDSEESGDVIGPFTNYEEADAFTRKYSLWEPRGSGGYSTVTVISKGTAHSPKDWIEDHDLGDDDEF